MLHKRSGKEVRKELVGGQQPFAAIRGCSDSRVPPEIIFDQGLGDLFVVRNAGNVVCESSLASVEYAVEVLRTPLIVVLGHTGCGAVAAAIERVREGTSFPGHIGHLVEAVVPAARAARDAGGDWFERAVIENVRATVDALVRRSEIISVAVRERRVTIAGAVYTLHAGTVTLLP